MTISDAGDPPEDLKPGAVEKHADVEAANQEPASEEVPEPARELSLEEQLQLLLIDHRELDKHIAELQQFPYVDQLEIQRLKKKKLHLKDAITYLKDQIIPDWNA